VHAQHRHPDHGAGARAAIRTRQMSSGRGPKSYL
jgi:hypothetical protein